MAEKNQGTGPRLDLLAVPEPAFYCIQPGDADILRGGSSAVLDALRHIRSAEAKSGSPDRLRALSERIKEMEEA